jgi:GT2 family glycosyltransferase
MRDRGNLTRQCLESVERKTTYRHYEALIVDNGSAEPASVDFLREAGRRHRVLRYDAPFNFSAIINFAAKQAQGEYLLFLNNDTQVISPHWMGAMLEHAQRPEVGAVGARLLYADGRIQHAGVFIMGIPTAVAGHMFKFLPAKYPGYLAVPRMIQNCTAVTAACMMVRRQVFESVGGFDQAFRVAFGDVDFCLRLRDLGMLVVYTPLATLFHYESASRGTLHPPEDDRLFRDRWRRFFEGARDPYWNPNLSVESEIFRLAV